ncbi:LANO_0H23618g1_1 [Lachancea nothofagi CBS 11611]|uniref:LANO_0H23618g1_1 n=1 Tax=Lachancea nothofagi CBS 11611 TaxID=1266666 RepID=A0A1G4KNN2_9SACH|nr:LANO_0H23618g1_1 [Lachancea nothofagi CBS 11611]
MGMALRKNPHPELPMVELRDLNETHVPRKIYHQESTFPHHASISHNSSSTAASSVRSPLFFNNLSSEATEYMRLTPVNIKNLTSPTRGPESLAPAINDENSNYTAYKENFNLISRKLEKLLDELNVIYREIGYSNTEISDKEKLIFNHISDSITGFFEHANQERDSITADNQVSQQVIQRILQVINDPKGTVTIPDLYTRNVIVNSGEQNSSSPRKQSSLLTRRKTITKAKSYVIKTYTPKLNNYLDSVIKLKTVASAIGDFEPVEQEWDVHKLLSVVPPLETCKYYKTCLSSAHHDVDKTCEFIINHRQALLSTINFNDVSDTMVERVETITSMFEREFEIRTKKLHTIGKSILSLLKVLDLNAETNLDEPTLQILRQIPMDCGNKSRQLHTAKKFKVSSSTVERLDQVCRKFRTIELERKQEKEKHVQNCYQLWEKLKIPQSYINKFETSNSDLSVTALKHYAEELSRLQEMKKKLIKNLIQDSWNKIQDLWSAMHLSGKDTTAFKEMFSTMIERSKTLEDDEKVLETCEVEIVDLEKKYALYKPLLKLIDEFRSLQSDKFSLEKSSRDSSRLLLRNSHRILLEEEKTRKRITRHFPNVIRELVQKLTTFEEDSGKPFMLEGARFLESVLQQEQEIISKYPRSRINSNFKSGCVAAATKPKISPVNRSPRKDRAQPRTQPKSHRKTVQRTPLKSSISGTTNTSLSSEQSSTKPSYNRYMRATRMSSPIRDVEHEIPSINSMRSSPTKIPTLTRSATFPRESTFFSSNLKPKTRMMIPEGLTQISPNKLNTLDILKAKKFGKKMPEASDKMSLIPLLEKAASRDKENMAPLYSLKSPIKVVEGAFPTLQSPQRETNNSVYKISRSPEGKFVLNVESNVTESGEGEDTSIMADDDNFAIWKRERLARIDSMEGSNDDLPSSVNWETDVF